LINYGVGERQTEDAGGTEINLINYGVGERQTEGRSS
jgi:hypothetical protein